MMTENSKRVILMSVAIATGTTLLLSFFLKSTSLTSIAITFITTMAVALVVSYYLIRNSSSHQIENLRQKLEDLGLEVGSHPEAGVSVDDINTAVKAFVIAKNEEIEKLRDVCGEVCFSCLRSYSCIRQRFQRNVVLREHSNRHTSSDEYEGNECYVCKLHN